MTPTSGPTRKIIAALMALAAVLTGVQMVAAAPQPCAQIEEGSGGGDNEAECRWSCDGGQRLKLAVDSKDEVPVEGWADCASVPLDCSGTQWCTSLSSILTDGPGSGTCSARSDEWWESELKVSCTSYYDCGASCGDYNCDPCKGEKAAENAEKKSGNTKSQHQGSAPPQANAAVDPAYDTTWTAAFTGAKTVDTGIRATPIPYASVTIEIVRGVATAQVCTLDVCGIVRPTCEYTETTATCRVG